jgi:hypothetical protein
LGIVVIELRPSPRSAKQQFAQGVLQQIHAHVRFDGRTARIAAAASRPGCLDLPDPLAHQLTVAPMRSAMERQPQPDAGDLVAGKQQAVPAKILETNAHASHRIEKRSKALLSPNLQGKQVVALQARVIVRPTWAIDRAKGKWLSQRMK